MFPSPFYLKLANTKIRYPAVIKNAPGTLSKDWVCPYKNSSPAIFKNGPNPCFFIIDRQLYIKRDKNAKKRKYGLVFPNHVPHASINFVSPPPNLKALPKKLSKNIITSKPIRVSLMLPVAICTIEPDTNIV